jgi:hypothetical protein
MRRAAGMLYCRICCRWVFNTVRGIDDEPVTPKDKVRRCTQLAVYSTASLEACLFVEACMSLYGTCTACLMVLVVSLHDRVSCIRCCCCCCCCGGGMRC